MKDKYLDKITGLLRNVRPGIVAQYELEFKNVFGAVGGYVYGKIFISCGKFGIALKLPPEMLKEKGAKPLKYFHNGHIKKEYVVLPKQIIEDKKQFRKLIKISIDYVKSF